MRDLPLPTLPFASIPDAQDSRRSLRRPQPDATADGLVVHWAASQDDIRAAQRLRYAIFAQELGARLTPLPDTPAGHDEDRFDAHCEHLLVRQGPGGAVIGTYRVLTPVAARRVGGLYSDQEFDLSSLEPLRAGIAELGRSCVHPDHRQGSVILALWAALARFMAANGLETMVGCASVGMQDGGHVAASLWNRLRTTHLAASEWTVRPRLPLPVEELRHDLSVEPPALIKGYLRCGAKVLGAPAWDPDFNTADLPMMLRLADLPERYRRHFLSA